MTQLNDPLPDSCSVCGEDLWNRWVEEDPTIEEAQCIECGANYSRETSYRARFSSRGDNT